jgi:hypothetical protein
VEKTAKKRIFHFLVKLLVYTVLLRDFLIFSTFLIYPKAVGYFSVQATQGWAKPACFTDMLKTSSLQGKGKLVLNLDLASVPSKIV